MAGITTVNGMGYSRDAIHVAGAGPAGLAAAIILARANREVVVHEANREVGYRFRRDFQGLDNWTTLGDALQWLGELGLDTRFTAHPLSCGTAFDDQGTAYEIHSDMPLFYLVERGPGEGSLDRGLLRQAQALGVQIRFNDRMTTLNGKCILAAGPRATDAIAVGYHFDTDMDDGFWFICDDALAPQGYAYLLVHAGRGTVKTCMFSGFRQKKQYVENTAYAFQRLAGLRMQNPVDHGGAGNFHIPVSAYRAGHPTVGEQAGFQDTLWGFGIRLAIYSGVLAARSLLNGEDYDRLWRRELLPQMQTSVVNRVLFSRLGNRGYRRFLRLHTGSRTRWALHRLYRPSLIKRLLYPWAKLHYQSRRATSKAISTVNMRTDVTAESRSLMQYKRKSP